MKKRLRGLLGIYLALALLLASGVALAYTVTIKIDPSKAADDGCDVSASYENDTGTVNISSGTDYTDIGGEQITLKAVAADGWTFVGWSGTYSGNEHTLTFTDSEASTTTYEDPYSDVAITAKFERTGAPPSPDPGGGSDRDLWYEEGNTFGSNDPTPPTQVLIDSVPVSYTGDGSRFTVDCLSQSARHVTAKWGNSSITVNFRPDANAYCTEIVIPRTGGASALGYALASVAAALWACKSRRK